MFPQGSIIEQREWKTEYELSFHEPLELVHDAFEGIGYIALPGQGSCGKLHNSFDIFLE
jgi:hypothetical protein